MTVGFCFEPVTLILRAGPKMKTFGDDYNFSATITIDRDQIKVKGASGVLPPPSEIKEMIRFLKSNFDAQAVTWERRKSDHTKEVIA